jgi:hypothetical protein
MKIIANKFFITLVYLLVSFVAFAGPNPPAPTHKKPPPPPGLPIDENIIILFLIAFLFGIYILYKNNLKDEKTPI